MPIEASAAHLMAALAQRDMHQRFAESMDRIRTSQHGCGVSDSLSHRSRDIITRTNEMLARRAVQALYRDQSEF
jgi:hypothetical protein